VRYNFKDITFPNLFFATLRASCAVYCKYEHISVILDKCVFLQSQWHYHSRPFKFISIVLRALYKAYLKWLQKKNLKSDSCQYKKNSRKRVYVN
jgi:hypothetical protein